MNSVKIRKSNFEIMRIISMILIILWHIILHGKLLENSVGPFNIYYKFILYFAIVHVNSFLLLTGYFQSKSKFKLSKLLNLVLEVIFYSFLIFFLGVKFNIIKDYNVMDYINNLLPSSVGNYWFICSYIIVYIFSDYINKFISYLDKRQFKRVLIVMFLTLSVFVWISGTKFLLNDGYNFYHMIFMYMIGAYLRIYPLKESYHFKKMSGSGYKTLIVFLLFIVIIINLSLNAFAHDIAYMNNFLYEFAYRVLSLEYLYSAPLVIVQTVLYFEIFNGLNIKSKIVNYISSCTFGIYLLHDNITIRNWLYHFLRIDIGFFGYKKLLYVFAVVFGIFLIGLIVESIRKFIFFILGKTKIICIIKDKVRGYIESLNYKINW